MRPYKLQNQGAIPLLSSMGQFDIPKRNQDFGRPKRFRKLLSHIFFYLDKTSKLISVIISPSIHIQLFGDEIVSCGLLNRAYSLWLNS